MILASVTQLRSRLFSLFWISCNALLAAAFCSNSCAEWAICRKWRNRIRFTITRIYTVSSKKHPKVLADTDFYCISVGKSTRQINHENPLLHKAPQTKSPLKACRNFRKGCSLFEASAKRFSMAWRCAPCCLRRSEGEGDGFKKSFGQHRFRISVCPRW